VVLCQGVDYYVYLSHVDWKQCSYIMQPSSMELNLSIVAMMVLYGLIMGQYFRVCFGPLLGSNI